MSILECLCECLCCYFFRRSPRSEVTSCRVCGFKMLFSIAKLPFQRQSQFLSPHSPISLSALVVIYQFIFSQSDGQNMVLCNFHCISLIASKVEHLFIYSNWPIQFFCGFLIRCQFFFSFVFFLIDLQGLFVYQWYVLTTSHLPLTSFIVSFCCSDVICVCVV